MTEGARLVSRTTLDPKLDIVFHLLLGDPKNKHLLVAFLTAALQPRVPIVDVTVLNPITRRSHITAKGSVLDLYVRLNDGRRVLVEIQISRRPHFTSRALFYWARAYEGQLPRGHQYGTLEPTAGVFVLDYDEFTDDRFHRTFELRDTKSQEPLSDALCLHFFELNKLRHRAPDTVADPMLRWAQFLAARTDQELEAISMTDPTIKQAKEALEELSADHWAREAALKREWDLASYEHELVREIAEAELRGRRGLIEEQLRLKFGGLADEIVTRIAHAGRADLDLWALRVLTATSLDEVLG